MLGNSVFPRAVAGRFHTLLAIFRQLHLAYSLLLATILSRVRLPFVIPTSRPYSSSHDWSLRRSIEPFDVFFVDQLSACIPVLRWGLRTRVVFYCHFPDLLLSEGSKGVKGAGPAVFTSPAAALKHLYRMPLNYIEGATTGEADKILVNSEYTADVFRSTFASLGRIPRVVYPGVEPSLYTAKEASPIHNVVPSDRPTVLSINRLEDKKDLGLAIEAFAVLRAENSSNHDIAHSRLVLIGGYDPRVADNVRTLRVLHRAIFDAGLTVHVWDPTTDHPSPTSPTHPSISSSPPSSDANDVVIILNAPSSYKLALLTAPSTRVLLYTPSDEHLGIVPLEAMASGLPVLCTDSGGPRETVLDGHFDSASPDPLGTGLLRPPIPSLWASALHTLLTLPPSTREAVAKAGRARVEERFSLAVMSRHLDRVLVEVRDLQTSGKRPDVWLEERLWIGIMVTSVPILAFWMIAWAFWREPDLLSKLGRVMQVYSDHMEKVGEERRENRRLKLEKLRNR